MEHLSKNTQSDRMIKIIEDIKDKNQDIASKQIKEFVDKIINVIAGVLSSIFSGCVVSMIKQDGMIPLGIVGLLFSFIIIVFIVWFSSVRWILPFFYKQFPKEKPIDLSESRYQDEVSRFNTEIIHKLSEANESIRIAQKTSDAECVKLNLIFTLYKIQEIVNFMHDTFFTGQMEIRDSVEDVTEEFIRHSFNKYAVFAVLDTIICIKVEINEVLLDIRVKELKGYELLCNDFHHVCEELDEVIECFN